MRKKKRECRKEYRGTESANNKYKAATNEIEKLHPTTSERERGQWVRKRTQRVSEREGGGGEGGTNLLPGDTLFSPPSSFPCDVIPRSARL